MSGKSVNEIALIGHVANDPYTPERNPDVAHFAVVTHKDLANGRVRTDRHNCVAWHNEAGFVRHNVRRGDRVYIKGRMEYETVREDDIALVEARIQVKEVILLGEKR